MLRRSGTFMIALLAFALALRVLVPTGWMPAWNGDGQFAFVPCPAAEPAAVEAHGQHHQASAEHGHWNPQEAPEHQSAKDCPFAPLLAGGALPEAGAIELARFDFRELDPQLVRSSPRTGARILPRPPSTGPPALA